MKRTRAEAEVRRRLRPHLRDLLRIARVAESVARSLVKSVEERTDEVAHVQRLLAGRLADDLRCMQTLTLAGYGQQAATVGASAYEVAFSLAYLGNHLDRARQWLAHVDPKTAPWGRKKTVAEVAPMVFPDRSRPLEFEEVSYTVMCWFKHTNPIAAHRFAPSYSAVQHLLNSDPDFACVEMSRACLLFSLRGPLIGLVATTRDGILSENIVERLVDTTNRYLIVEEAALQPYLNRSS